MSSEKDVEATLDKSPRTLPTTVAIPVPLYVRTIRWGLLLSAVLIAFATRSDYLSVPGRLRYGTHQPHAVEVAASFVCGNGQQSEENPWYGVSSPSGYPANKPC